MSAASAILLTASTEPLVSNKRPLFAPGLRMDAPRTRPISAYGLIGNGRTAALVSTDGSIDWLCMPRFDSDSLFCALLDSDIGGRFAIQPVHSFRARHHYIPNTNVLKTHFQTQDGTAELIDCFTVTDERTKRQELWPDHEILRKLRCIRGSMKFRLEYFPTHTHGKDSVPLENKGRWGIVTRERQELLALQHELDPKAIRIETDMYERNRAVAEFELHAGQELWFSLIYENDEPAFWPPLGKNAEERLEKTIRYWTQWISRCRYKGPYERHVLRSALVLKLLVYAPSGAVVAAPTTSLPEWIGGTRNWDYRFCWLRDASFTVRVFIELGYLEEAQSYVSWLIHSTRLTRKPWRPRLQVLYDVYGENLLKEHSILWLSGYRCSRPVRIGNGAVNQRQLDVYGEVIESFRLIVPYLESVDHQARDLVLETGHALADLWNEPDEGIWEPRAGRSQNTHSKVMAWVGLKGADELVKKFGGKTRYDFGSLAAEVHQMIETHGYNSDLGAYTRTFGGNDLDGALLRLPMLGYCDPSSTRIRGTIDAIQKQLTKNGLVYRYKSGIDGINEAEGTFGLCNFWMAEALFRSGRLREGHSWLQNLLHREAHDLGLWSEEMNPDTGEYLGNYPQAFSHVGLINAAIAASECAAAVGRRNKKKVA